MSSSVDRTCFLIGQMSSSEDLSRLQTLRQRVLDPVLSKPAFGYRVVMPDEPFEDPAWFRQVMTMIDTAHILVADLTGDNANVYYELAVRHSLGLPFVLVCEHETRSDIGGLRYIRYPPGRPQDQAGAIESQLAIAHRAAVERRPVPNPISDFYGAPLTQVSPAAGLAQAYFVYLRSLVAAMSADADRVEIGGGEVRIHHLKRAQIEVWIPRRPASATTDMIERFLLERDPPALLPAKVAVNSRVFDLFALPQRGDGVVLVDIPRTMNTMEDVIASLERARRLAYGSRAWDTLVSQEIDRFRTALDLQILSSDLGIKKRVTIRDWPLPTRDEPG